MDVKPMMKPILVRNGGANKSPAPVRPIKRETQTQDPTSKRSGGARRGGGRNNQKRDQDLSQDIALKREKNRRCAKQCRARKKVRCNYLEEVIDDTEEKVKSLRKEMKYLKMWARELDKGVIPSALFKYRRDTQRREISGNSTGLKPKVKSEAKSETSPSNNLRVAEESLEEVEIRGVICNEKMEEPQDLKILDLPNVPQGACTRDGFLSVSVGFSSGTDRNASFGFEEMGNMKNEMFSCVKTEDHQELGFGWQLMYLSGD